MTDDSAAFRKAVEVAASDHGYVSVPAPRVAYRIAHSVSLASGVAITGGAALPKIVGGVAKGYVFRLRDVSGASISCLSLDLGHLDHASGIRVGDSRAVTISNTSVTNVTQGWGVNVGTSDPSSTAYGNTNVTLTGDSFSGFDSHFEEVLVFNSTGVTVSGCHFGSAVFHSSGGGLGLYQNDSNVTVSGNTFGPMVGNTGIYYAITVNNVTIENNTFVGDGSTTMGNTGIKGANVSDHGLFGQSSVANYAVDGNTFENLRIGLQLGAVNGARVSSNHFVGNNLAIQVTGGNSFKVHLDTPDSAMTINANTFTSNQSSIEFKGTGALQGVSIAGNDFGSAASAPITFVGHHTWTGLSITGNDSAARSGGIASFIGGAKLGSAQEIGGN